MVGLAVSASLNELHRRPLLRAVEGDDRVVGGGQENRLADGGGGVAAEAHAQGKTGMEKKLWPDLWLHDETALPFAVLPFH